MDALGPLLLVAVPLAAAGVLVPLAVRRKRRERSVAKAYLKGVRYILSDTPDAAIEEMTRAVEDEAGAHEIYFALGALFRRKGEHERAIRLHKNMLARPFLEGWLREQIELELALDYHRAGMTGRAIESYQKAAGASQRREALLGLRQLFEERSDFARAAEVEADRLRDGEGARATLSHLLAEAALREDDLPLAERFAKNALEADPSCAHAAWAMGIVAHRAKRGPESGDWLERACALDRELSPRIAPLLVELRGEAAATFFVERIAQADRPSDRHALALCARALGQPEVAASHLRRALELDPRDAGPKVVLGQILLDGHFSDKARKELEVLLKSLSAQEPAFVCRGCGAAFVDPVFRCLRCGVWGRVERG